MIPAGRGRAVGGVPDLACLDLRSRGVILPSVDQAYVSAAAEDVRPVAGEYFTGLRNDHTSGVCEVHLANAPESVLERLHAMHRGVYVNHNDAPRSLDELQVIIKQINVPALRDAGISIHQIGPTPHGYARVAVDKTRPTRRPSSTRRSVPV
jgi:hypothetical protein